MPPPLCIHDITKAPAFLLASALQNPMLLFYLVFREVITEIENPKTNIFLLIVKLNHRSPLYIKALQAFYFL